MRVFAGSEQNIVVVEDTNATPNISYAISEHIWTHNHEEADTIIPLHVKDVLDSHRGVHVDFWSPDTEVFLLLFFFVLFLILLLLHPTMGADIQITFITFFVVYDI